MDRERWIGGAVASVALLWAAHAHAHIKLLQPVAEGRVPGQGVGADHAHAALGEIEGGLAAQPQPAWMYSGRPNTSPARVFTTTMSNGWSWWPMRRSSASTSAAVAT